MKTTSNHVRRLTKLALLIAIELVMRAIGLGAVPVGPLNMSFLTLPIAMGAILCGPLEGMIMGAIFGILSLTDAVSGRSVMTGTFFSISPLHTVILCVAMRMLMGLCCGYVYRLCAKADHKGTWSYFVGAVSAPLRRRISSMGPLAGLWEENSSALDIWVHKAFKSPCSSARCARSLSGCTSVPSSSYRA